MERRLSALGLIILMILAVFSPALADSYLDALQPDQKVHGFTVLNLYDNSADRAMGARFISDKYGFIIDLMQIQSVPQAFYWIKTPPTSSKGEPHACEHLLLGKGNLGRYVAALEDMALGNSSAWTAQTRTCYHFNTTAGEKTFYDIFEAKLQALLHPDFTDEEIRREVCHIGVTVDQQDGLLSLEEKGTVYTEMVSSFEKPWYHIYSPINDMVYGENHPLSYISGGDPDVMRSMTAEDMRRFHKAYYHLANMGVIISIPDNIPVDSFLKRITEILNRCQDYPDSSSLIGIGSFDFQPVNMSPTGTKKIAVYPSERNEDPGYIIYAWPADLELDFNDRFMLDLFLETFASGETSNLYDLFINSQTRQVNLGGNYIFGGVDYDFGNSIFIGFVGIDNEHVNETMLDSIRLMIVKEIKQVYDFVDGSEELREFNREVESHLIQMRKQKEDYLNSPPMFGFRSGFAGGWLSNLEALEKVDSFHKSLIFKNGFIHADSLLATGKNFWKDFINKCRLLKTPPYAVGCSPEQSVVTQMREAKEARIAGYIADFKQNFGGSDEQKAIGRYKEEFDKKTAELEKIAADQELPGFIDNPPMTLDDQLKYETIILPGNVPLVASTFDNMNSSTISIALRLDVIPESLLVYVPFLPDILTSIGVIENGEVVPYDVMQERLRKEVLRLYAGFDNNMQTGRIELALTGTGSNLDELKNALTWMRLAMYSPYLSVDNLPRMTDLIDQTLISLRNVMKGSEESWVNYPARAYKYQTNPLFMSTNTFLTKIHHFHRLRFRLTDPGTKAEPKELVEFIDALAEYSQGKTREKMTEILNMLTDQESQTDVSDFEPRLSALSETARVNALLVIKAMKACLPDIPDADLQGDWAYLCREMKADIMVKPEKVIADINIILDLIRKTDNSRMYIVSNAIDRLAAFEQIEDFVSQLDAKNKSVRQNYAADQRIIDRLKNRLPNIDRPVYVGLVYEGTRNGVVINSAKYSAEYDTSTSSILDCLTGKLYSGGGAHGLFMKTWSAGLAYSNGYSINETSGRVGYYAERCPDVSETMRFVVNELKNADDNPGLIDYTIAQMFGRTRAASRYESRGKEIAADLADGCPPERVADYRSKVLKMRRMDGLYQKLVSRMENVYGKVLTGYGEPLSKSDDGYFFLIGPETQFESFEDYIESTEGKQTIYRLYPRDFWLTM